MRFVCNFVCIWTSIEIHKLLHVIVYICVDDRALFMLSCLFFGLIYGDSCTLYAVLFILWFDLFSAFIDHGS